MMEVVWLDEAVHDLEEIGRTIAEDDPPAAYRVLRKIEASANSLERYPEFDLPPPLASACSRPRR